MTGTSDTERRMYGGFWIRTAAFVLDFIIVTVLVFLIGGEYPVFYSFLA
uniref:RDD family protein n=1 Tax=Paenibacillus polymyxa TaxID=1406 RepID=A0AAE9PRC9_PAEPO